MLHIFSINLNLVQVEKVCDGGSREKNDEKNLDRLSYIIYFRYFICNLRMYCFQF